MTICIFTEDCPEIGGLRVVILAAVKLSELAMWSRWMLSAKAMRCVLGLILTYKLYHNTTNSIPYINTSLYTYLLIHAHNYYQHLEDKKIITIFLSILSIKSLLLSKIQLKKYIWCTIISKRLPSQNENIKNVKNCKKVTENSIL